MARALPFCVAAPHGSRVRTVRAPRCAFGEGSTGRRIEASRDADDALVRFAARVAVPHLCTLHGAACAGALQLHAARRRSCSSLEVEARALRVCVLYFVDVCCCAKCDLRGQCQLARGYARGRVTVVRTRATSISENDLFVSPQGCVLSRTT